MEYDDGSIQSSNLPTKRNTADIRDYKLYRAMVVDYIYSDDNVKNPTTNAKTAEMMYSVVLLGGFNSGRVHDNVRLAKHLGGKYNYHTQRLQKSSKTFATPLNQHDGDIVYVQFLQGDPNFPVIVAFGSNLQEDQVASIKKADGPLYKWQYNGVNETIDKNGNYTLAVKGGTYDANADVLTPNNEATITHAYNPKDESFTRTYKSGLTVKEDGKGQKVDVTAGKVLVTIDGKGNKASITVGETIVEIDGASGKIKLSGKAVDLGSSVSDFVTMFTELAAAFNAHTHTTTAPGSPTSPPGAPLLQSVGSQTIKVQA